MLRFHCALCQQNLRCARRLLASLLFGLMIVACSTRPPAVTTFQGIASKVHDGDSIHLTPTGQSRVIIRLAGIDAPELQQSHGRAARDHLRSMILSRFVEAQCHKVDRYDRQLCVIYADGADVNKAMVSSGHAWHYKTYQNEQTISQRRQYTAAESNARSQKLGLWRFDNPIAPWDYRS